MKIFTKGLLFTLVLFVCFSCGQAENTATDAKEKKEMVKGVKGKKGKANRDGAKKGKANRDGAKTGNANRDGAKKGNANKYWGALKTELNLDTKKWNRVRQLTNKNATQVANLSKEKADGYLNKVKEIRIAEKDQIKKILGNELFQKKLAFDKTWAKNAPAPKGRK